MALLNSFPDVQFIFMVYKRQHTERKPLVMLLQYLLTLITMSWIMLTSADSSQIKIILRTEKRIKQHLITKELIFITKQVSIYTFTNILLLCDWQTKGNHLGLWHVGKIAYMYNIHLG